MIGFLHFRSAYRGPCTVLFLRDPREDGRIAWRLPRIRQVWLVRAGLVPVKLKTTTMLVSDLLMRMRATSHLLTSCVLLDGVAASWAASHVCAPCSLEGGPLLVLLLSLPPSLLPFEAWAGQTKKTFDFLKIWAPGGSSLQHASMCH